MHIGLIVNTRSGRNKAAMLADRCSVVLNDRKHTVIRVDPHDLSVSGDQFAHMDRLIIIGGDGTVHHALPHLIEHQVPFYHLATGTSNLISKELKMPRNPAAIANWIEQGGSMEIDVARLDGVPFLIMCNFGMDASVIHRFESSRTSSGGFRNYVFPVAKEVFRPQPASVQIQIDEEQLSAFPSSNLLIANMRSYALGLNPCNHADPTDTKLDLLECWCGSTPVWSIQGLLARCRLPIFRSRRRRATKIVVNGGSRQSRVQVDGEIARTPSMPDGILQPAQEIQVTIGHDRIRAISVPNP